MSKWTQRLKRPSLLWMSRDDVKRVRDKIIQLYLSRGEYVFAAAPEWSDRILNRRVKISGGTIPCFSWERYICPFGEREKRRVLFEAWLVLERSGKGNPCWDVKVDGSEVSQYPFSSPLTQEIAQMVMRYSLFFPFGATDNFLENNGAPIA